MAKRIRSMTKKEIQRRIKEKYGQGKREDYVPWLTIQDVASDGNVHRIGGIKIPRVHQLFSNHETRYFYLLEWSKSVVDIREQFPLDLEDTQKIADTLGIKHPMDIKSKHEVVMTSDFMITVLDSENEVDMVRTVKESEELNDERVIEKLEIERVYWESRGIDWGIVTEKEIPATFAKNVEILRPFHQPGDASSSKLSPQDIYDAFRFLTDLVTTQDLPLREAGAICDGQLGFVRGSSLDIAYHLIATRRWKIDMNNSLDPDQPIVLLNVED